MQPSDVGEEQGYALPEPPPKVFGHLTGLSLRPSAGSGGLGGASGAPCAPPSEAPAARTSPPCAKAQRTRPAPHLRAGPAPPRRTWRTRRVNADRAGLLGAAQRHWAGPGRFRAVPCPRLAPAPASLCSRANLLTLQTGPGFKSSPADPSVPKLWPRAAGRSRGPMTGPRLLPEGRLGAARGAGTGLQRLPTSLRPPAPEGTPWVLRDHTLARHTRPDMEEGHFHAVRGPDR